MKRRTTWALALLAVTTWASAAGAATLTIYTDKAEWETAVAGQYQTEEFADDVLDAGVSFTSSESGHINPSLEFYQDVLTSFSANEPQTTWSFAPQITAYGGNWDLGGPGGGGNSLHVIIPDWPQEVGYIPNTYSGGFWGFTSDTPFTSVQLIGGTGLHQQNYTLDDMVYSQVPEPATLLLLALGSLGFFRRSHSTD